MGSERKLILFQPDGNDRDIGRRNPAHANGLADRIWPYSAKLLACFQPQPADLAVINVLWDGLRLITDNILIMR